MLHCNFLPNPVWLKAPCAYIYTFTTFWNIFSKIQASHGWEEWHVTFIYFCIQTLEKRSLNSMKELILSHFRVICSEWEHCQILCMVHKTLLSSKKKIWGSTLFIFIFFLRPNGNITSVPSFLLLLFTEPYYTPSTVSICCWISGKNKG